MITGRRRGTGAHVKVIGSSGALGCFERRAVGVDRAFSERGGGCAAGRGFLMEEPLPHDRRDKSRKTARQQRVLDGLEEKVGRSEWGSPRWTGARIEL